MKNPNSVVRATVGAVLGVVPAIWPVAYGAMQALFGLVGGGSEVGPIRGKAQAKK